MRALVPARYKVVDDCLGPEFQLRRPEAKVFLNSKSDQKNIMENMLEDNCYLEWATLDLSFISP